MNKFVTSALALTAAGTLAEARPGDSEWSGLDSQLESIRSSYTADSHDLLASVGGLVKSTLRSADLETSFATTDFATPPAAADALGWNLDNAFLWGEGQVGDSFSWRISMNGSGGSGGTGVGSSLGLAEAFADWNFDNGTLRMGDFGATTARHLGYDVESQLFSNTAAYIGNAASSGPGVQYMGSAGSIDYAVGARNGGDGLNDELDFHGRVQWNMNDGVGGDEGAYGASDGLVGTVGAWVLARGDVGTGAGSARGTSIGVDAQFTGDRWSVGASVVSNDDDAGDNTPIMAQGSYMVTDDGEVALRFEDADATTDRSRITAGYNWYQQGNNGFWQINVGTDETSTNVDGTFILISWILGESGNTADAGSGQR